MSAHQWFIVRTQPNRERVAATYLRMGGIGAYVPLEKFRLKRRNKWLAIEKPLFRGYLFAPKGTFEGEESAIKDTHGVIRLLPMPGDPNGAPATLSDAVVAEIMGLERAGVFDNSKAPPKTRNRPVNLYSAEAKALLTKLREVA